MLLRARSLTYLLVCTRLQGDVGAADAMIDTTLEASRHAGLPEYEAIVHATAAWIAFRRGDSARVRDEAERAVDLLHAIPNPYPFDWMAYLPLVGAALGEGAVDEACRCAEPVLSDTQQALEEPLGQLLRDAVSANARGERDEAAALLGRAIEAAHSSAYL